ncbi:hypothetical protein BVRB_5g115680 [Beta vulgaris subsp. vulgaris]|nr:hypothetical protein BVRB_5g115680 [Beta vulgaris subsp. vulgaris]
MKEKSWSSNSTYELENLLSISQTNGRSGLMLEHHAQ